MKVLMVNTPASLSFRGGDLTQMGKTAEALRPLGVDVVESFDLEPNATGFDIAHVFNLRTIDVTLRQVRHLKGAGVPVVMSPIYLNPSVALWGTRVIRQIFGTARGEEELPSLLDRLRARELKIKRPGGAIWAAESQNRRQPDFDERQREILTDVDHLLPNSILEMSQLMRTLRVFDIPFTVVPYAADARIFLDPDPEPFVAKHALHDFVLQVGRIESSKNQVMLACALRDLDVPLVFIGSSQQPDYLQWCRVEGGKNLTVISHLAHEELRAAYAAARVHALPSWIETCGLVTMEAALANCEVVVSTAGHEVEYYRDLAYYCDPADVGSIRAAVVAALEGYDRNEARRRQLKELIMRDYTWQVAAEATLRAYEAALRRVQSVARV